MSTLGNIRRRLQNRLRPHGSAEGRLALLLDHVGVRTFIDVGANHGQTGHELRSGGWRGRILSFEPLSIPHAALSAAAARDPMWTAAPRTAVGERDGEIEINISASDMLSSVRYPSPTLRSLLPAAASIAREIVPLRRLDTLLADHPEAAPPWFVKIDTQGYEAEVLAACEDLLPQIVGFKLELSLVPLYEDEHTAEHFLAWMRERGYEPWLVEPISYLRDRRRQLQVDAVFVRPGPGDDAA
jgi:FkbM family methyltransferase